MKRAPKITVILMLALLLMLSSTMVTGAITNGTPDDGNHPYAVMIVFYREGEPVWRCTGSLISPTVVLTAGHCTSDSEGDPTSAQVWTQSDMTDTGYPYTGGTTGIPFTNPNYCNYCIGNSNGLPGYSYRDNGIVVLDAPLSVSRYAELPTPGLVDTLKNKTTVDLVGYGVSEQVMGGGPPKWTGPTVRMFATSNLISGNFSFSADYLRLSQNPGGGSGGTCFGDSGGPNLLGGTDTILGVTSFGTNGNCAGTGYAARIDIPDVLDWIDSYLD